MSLQYRRSSAARIRQPPDSSVTRRRRRERARASRGSGGQGRPRVGAPARGRAAGIGSHSSDSERRAGDGPASARKRRPGVDRLARPRRHPYPSGGGSASAAMASVTVHWPAGSALAGCYSPRSCPTTHRRKSRRSHTSSRISQAQKVEKLRSLVKTGGSLEIYLVWVHLHDGAVEVARTEPALFRGSLDRSPGVGDLPPFKALSDKFKRDVEATALGFLSANRDFVTGEMEKIGAPGADTGDQAPTAEQQRRIHPC